MSVINAYFLASNLLLTAIDNGAEITVDEADDIIDNNLLFSEIEKFNTSPSRRDTGTGSSSHHAR